MDNNQLKRFLTERGPDILSFLATAGVGVTAFLSGRAAIKMYETLNDGKNRSKNQAFKDCWKYAILPVITGVGTIASIWGSRKISAKQLASMTAAAGYLAANKIKLNKQKDHVEKEETTKKLPVSFEETGYGDTYCLEGFTGRWFKSSPEAIEQAIKTFNQMYASTVEMYGFGYAQVNDLYDLLGIQTTYFGHEFGWSDQIHEGNEIKFETEFVNLENGLGDVYVIRPAENYYPIEKPWMW